MSEGSVSGSVGVGTATVPAAEIPPDPSTGCRIRQTIAGARRSHQPDASAKEHIFTKDRGSCNNWIELLCEKVRLFSTLRWDARCIRRFPRAEVRPVDPCRLGGPLARCRETDDHEEILRPHSRPAGAGSCPGSEAS
jgi:hypothetical protein